MTESEELAVRSTQVTAARKAAGNDNLGDLRAVQTFARHVHTSQTARYTRTTARRLQDVVEALKY